MNSSEFDFRRWASNFHFSQCMSVSQMGFLEFHLNSFHLHTEECNRLLQFLEMSDLLSFPGRAKGGVQAE